MLSNTTGTYNTAVGYQSLYNNTTASYNVGLGYLAGYQVTTGAYNTIVGYYTGVGLTTGNYNTIIGSQVTGLTSSLSNNVIIADGAGTQRIRVFSTGNVSIANTTDSGYKLDVSGTGRYSNELTLGNLASDPTGANGMIYYNTTTNKFRGYENGAWVNLI